MRQEGLGGLVRARPGNDLGIKPMQQARRRKTALECQVAGPAILRVASGPMRRGLRIARCHAGQCLDAVSTAKWWAPSRCRPQDRCAEDCASPRLFPTCQRLEAGAGSSPAGAQEENGLGRVRSPTGHLACRLRTDAQRIAYRRLACRPVARRRLHWEIVRSSVRISRVPSGPMCRGLRIAPPVSRPANAWRGLARGWPRTLSPRRPP
jgi:hypothetical protein